MGKLSKRRARELAHRLYDAMLETAGPRHWWPCDRAGVRGGRDEIVIGAILTQNTAWSNVEKALASLRGAGLLDLEKLARRKPERIARHIVSAGYFNVKARRLSAAARFFAPGGRERLGELDALGTEELRERLLAVNGVGPETADSILLYAFERPSFVIDAYTLRVGRRHGLFDEETGYEAARAWFMEAVEADVGRYNEYHALLVWIGNRYCKPRPRCEECPLFTASCFAGRQSYAAMKRELVEIQR